MTRPLATQYTENCPFFSGAPGKYSRGSWGLEKGVPATGGEPITLETMTGKTQILGASLPCSSPLSVLCDIRKIPVLGSLVPSSGRMWWHLLCKHCGAIDTFVDITWQTDFFHLSPDVGFPSVCCNYHWWIKKLPWPVDRAELR